MEEKDSMEREEFVQAVTEMVSRGLGSRYQVERTEVRKNNGVVKESLLVRQEGSECAPSFYLEELYRSYCGGLPAEMLAEHIMEIVREENGGFARVTDFLSKAWLEENLFLRLVNFERNLEQLKDAVYVRRLDLAAVFYVLTKQDEEGIKSFRLPKEVWEKAGLGSAEQYFEKILKNTERLFPADVKRIEESLAECVRKNGEKEPDWLISELQGTDEAGGSLFYVLSNKVNINGAITLFYPGMLGRLEKKFPGGFYLIPSSIHEMLLLAESEETEVRELNQMVCEVNESHVAPEEVLSDHVYYYSKTRGLCSMAG